MKVLFLTQIFDPTRGGGEVLFYLIAKELVKRGHNIYVICHKIYNRHYLSKSSYNNVKIYHVNPPLLYKGSLPASLSQNILYLINALRLGLKIVKEENIDIIHANTYTPALAGAILSKLAKKPFILTIHDVGLVNGLKFWRLWMKQFNSSFISSLIGYIIELITINLPASIIITPSKASKEDILRIRPKALVVVIPNAIDLEMYKVDNASLRYDNEIVFIGRAVYYKNLQVVLKAMQHVIREIPDTKLIVIGDGPMKKIWKKMAKHYGINNNVMFTGYVSHEEKINIMRKATALVFPSIWEGFGMVILEAWALRKPAIVSKIKPLSDLVKNEKEGLHVAPFNSQNWSKSILFLLNNKSLAKQMGYSGYTELIRKYTIKGLVNRLEYIYKRVN